MAIDDIFKLAVKSKFGLGQDCVNTFHYKVLTGGALLLDPAQTLADNWQAQVQPSYLNLMASSMILELLEVRQVFGGLASLDVPVNEPGLISGEQLPPMDCALISWRTGLIGRANRGRTYMPSPLETWQSAGTIAPGNVDNYQAAADEMITLNDAATGLIPQYQMVIFHTDATDSPEVTFGIVRNIIATQRRRRVGVGS